MFSLFVIATLINTAAAAQCILVDYTIDSSKIRNVFSITNYTIDVPGDITLEITQLPNTNRAMVGVIDDTIFSFGLLNINGYAYFDSLKKKTIATNIKPNKPFFLTTIDTWGGSNDNNHLKGNLCVKSSNESASIYKVGDTPTPTTTPVATTVPVETTAPVVITTPVATTPIVITPDPTTLPVITSEPTTSVVITETPNINNGSSNSDTNKSTNDPSSSKPVVVSYASSNNVKKLTTVVACLALVVLV